MVLSQEYILSRDGDRDCLEALAWLAKNASKYPTGIFVPPLTAKDSVPKEPRFIALYMRIGRKNRVSGGARISRLDAYDGTLSEAFGGTEQDIAAWFIRTILTSRRAGSMIVTSGIKRNVMDVFLASLGRYLLEGGYRLQPFCGSSGVLFIKIRRGKRTWTLINIETATGVALSTCMHFAQLAEKSTAQQDSLARALYSATVSVHGFLKLTFGSALHATAGMTAMDIARRSLPPEFAKWRPTPLLVAMERAGKGYRGGIAYAQRYRGPSWRVDVNRQYTSALTAKLPMASAFGRYISERDTPDGVFMCRLQLHDTVAYPIGIWVGNDGGFQPATVGRGSYVCILHTSEFPGLRAAGAIITPSYGFVYTSVFDLSGLVYAIQTVLDTFGKESPEGKLTKPIGNYVYGKFGQRPDRTELLYSIDDPGDDWFPYWDEHGKAWVEMWERNVTKHTASQHVDIAGTITGAARSQTVATWALLLALGKTVVRVHTDSLTLDSDPSSLLTLDDSLIGSWRLETQGEESIIVGANAYVDQDGAHVAGLSEPTAEMIERIYDGHVVYAAQHVKTPRRGFDRGLKTIRREYGKSG